MRVRELIEELREQDPDLEVEVQVWSPDENDHDDDWPTWVYGPVHRVQPNVFQGCVEIQAES